MAKVTDIRLGVRVDIVARKGADFHRRLHVQYYSGTTLVDFDFSMYTGATLQVRRKPNSPIVELTFSTAASSIVFGTSGRFDLELDWETMNNIRSGEYDYDMYLSNSQYDKRDFMFGKFIIADKITT